MITLVNSANSKGSWLKRWWAKPCWMMTFIIHLLADYQFSSDKMQAKESSKNNYMDCCIIEGDNLLSLLCHLIESSDMAWNTKLCWWSHGLTKVWTQSETDLWCWSVCSGSSHSHRLMPLIERWQNKYHEIIDSFLSPLPLTFAFLCIYLKTA